MLPLLLARLAYAGPDPVEGVLAAELERATSVFAGRSEKPHYVALAVEDRHEINLSARSGTLGGSREDRERYLDVDLRVGTPDLDSTHPLRGFSSMEDDNRERVMLPVTGEPGGYATRHAIWQAIDRQYRDAAERIVMVRANRSVKVEEESPAPDFEPRAPVVDRKEVPELSLDRLAWERLLVDVSAALERDPDVLAAGASLQAVRVAKTFVDTEGARIAHGRQGFRVTLQAETIAPDGDEVSVFWSADAHELDRLPSADAILERARGMVGELKALRDAPRGSPYSGPVILAGRASGVFFHEVFGHRVEGHRQKRESEGRTFAEYVGKPLLPAFVDVYDDPTVKELMGVELNGFYAYDDEGVAAQRAPLIEDGKFQGFLMGRSPLEDFPHSNGHGRRMAGSAPVARMGNTIVETTKSVPRAELREMLVAELTRQKLDYGMLVEEIEGGFTLTGRVEPNAFNVRASKSWRVYADGRPDELVRGVDLVGTPLVAFDNLVAAGDDREVFNGYCGAESGWVPVSAVAPSLLFRRLEFQLKEKGQERPPLLAKPDRPGDGAADSEEVPR